MPIIELKISGSEDTHVAQTLADAITSCTKEILNKKPEVTAIAVTFIPGSLWFINGQALDNSNQRSFYLGIKITEKTVSKEQKKKYLEAIDNVLRSTLSNLHVASYVHVAEVFSDAYGYGGVTMEHRFKTSSTKQLISN